MLALDHFLAEGKLALRTPEQAESAGFRWHQQGSQTRIELSGPMGVNATTLRSDGRELEVLQGDQRSHWDISDPALPVLESGWQLPLSALPYWLRGIPAPQFDVDELALESERLSLLRQAGWEVNVERYGRFGDLDLPTRLQIRHDERRVRLVIRRWHRETPP